MNNLYDYLKTRNSIIKVYGWNEVCDFCLLPGHQQRECQTAITCGICQGEHAGRRCPDIEKAPITSLTAFHNVPPLDNVVRNAFSSIKFGKLPQSVKKVKENRKRQRENANTNAYSAYVKRVDSEYVEYLKICKNQEGTQTVDESIVDTSPAEVQALEITNIATTDEKRDISDQKSKRKPRRARGGAKGGPPATSVNRENFRKAKGWLNQD